MFFGKFLKVKYLTEFGKIELINATHYLYIILTTSFQNYILKYTATSTKKKIYTATKKIL